MQTSDQKSIILFDGICNLCNASVKFILKRDLKEQFLFASLQSDAAKKILLQYNWKNYQLKSIVLIHDGKVYQKSSAVIKICQQLKWPWPLFSIAQYLPVSWRDWLYDIIAKRRYQWFGKKNECIMMIPEYKNRFI
jgi:predicted DCC family thiol-disulfide oxidoreductase YuxK